MTDYLINDVFLEEIGIILSDPNLRLSKIDQISRKWETRVAKAVSKDLSTEQLAELEELLEYDSNEDLFEWLEELNPKFKKVIDAQYKILKAELKLIGL